MTRLVGDLFDPPEPGGAVTLYCVHEDGMAAVSLVLTLLEQMTNADGEFFEFRTKHDGVTRSFYEPDSLLFEGGGLFDLIEYGATLYVPEWFEDFPLGTLFLQPTKNGLWAAFLALEISHLANIMFRGDGHPCDDCPAYEECHPGSTTKGVEDYGAGSGTDA